MDTSIFISKNFSPKKGKIICESPSNIALIKYWGKYGHQFPINPSLSFTLSNCKTETSIDYSPRLRGQGKFDFLYDGKTKKSFENKIEQFFERIFPFCPYLKNLFLKINSKNTFPHSSGIASSASAFSSLAFCIVSIEKRYGERMTEQKFLNKVSFIARLGSGSGSRSISGPLMIWGENEFHPGCSNFFAVNYSNKTHQIFKDYQNTVLIIEDKIKTLSSSEGHKKMIQHPFLKDRINQAKKNLNKIINAISIGDLEGFIKVVEQEAMTLHALMMSSEPPTILIKSKTLEVIELLKNFREKEKIPVCFTLDAGPNVHLLYPEKYRLEVMKFIEEKLMYYCQNNLFINDKVGLGTKLL
tara:strand:- start:214 stop:1284 length:1071 start_codon:yes stop_codon:yes gene_type:complete